MPSKPSKPIRLTAQARRGPLVSVGIPTYNRAESLKRAVASVLGQDYTNIELIICDNASTDQTESFCRELCQLGGRIRYFRQKKNQGPVANFREARKQARGEFFMWLCDDDWIGQSYLRESLEVLLRNPDYSLVAGLARYYENGQYVRDELHINLLHDAPWRRVLSHYYLTVCCGMFYGLMRREQSIRIPLRKVVGLDWLVVGSLAFLGKVRTLDYVYIHRQLTGMSQKYEKNATGLGVCRFQGRYPHLSTAIEACRDILNSSIYQRYGPIRRVFLAGGALAVICLTRTRIAEDLFKTRRNTVELLRRCYGGIAASRKGRKVFWGNSNP